MSLHCIPIWEEPVVPERHQLTVYADVPDVTSPILLDLPQQPGEDKPDAEYWQARKLLERFDAVVLISQTRHPSRTLAHALHASARGQLLWSMDENPLLILTRPGRFGALRTHGCCQANDDGSAANKTLSITEYDASTGEWCGFRELLANGLS